MLAMSFLQEGPNTSLSWLLYVLLGFLALVIFAGALTSRVKNGPVSKSEYEAVHKLRKVKSPSPQSKSPSRKRPK